MARRRTARGAQEKGGAAAGGRASTSAPTQARSNGRSRGNGRAGHGARARSNGRNGAAPQGDGPAALPLLVEKEETHPCFNCALCCSYMAVEIDEPTTNREYDYIVWYLYHPGVSVFVDWEGDWYLKIDVPCRHLTANGMCGVYEERPVICREFSFQDCEKNNPDEPPDKWLFTSADEFLGWFERQRPRSFQRFQDFQRRHRRKRTEAPLKRVRAVSGRRARRPSRPSEGADARR